MRRHIMGAIGLVLLAAVIVMFFVYGYEQVKQSAAAGIGLRVGLVLVAIWLAMPQIVQVTKRVPPWLLGSIALGTVALVIWPKLALAVIPIIGIMLVVQFVTWLFKPLPPRKRTSEPHAESEEKE
jgi:TRAP-type C4-dicarboxylate transport system permease small subunit